MKIKNLWMCDRLYRQALYNAPCPFFTTYQGKSMFSLALNFKGSFFDKIVLMLTALLMSPLQCIERNLCSDLALDSLVKSRSSNGLFFSIKLPVFLVMLPLGLLSDLTSILAKSMMVLLWTMTYPLQNQKANIGAAWQVILLPKFRPLEVLMSGMKGGLKGVTTLKEGEKKKRFGRQLKEGKDIMLRKIPRAPRPLSNRSITSLISRRSETRASEEDSSPKHKKDSKPALSSEMIHNTSERPPNPVSQANVKPLENSKPSHEGLKSGA